MSERIEVLIPDRLALPRFTVDITAANVVISYPAVANPTRLFNASGGYKFQQGDNFTIGSTGLLMPLSFQIDRASTVTNPFIKFLLIGVGVTSGKLYYFRELGNSSTASPYFGVTENYDTPLDIFIDLQNQPLNGTDDIKNEAFTLDLSIIQYNVMGVSMVGVPDDLDATVQLITPYIKIYHNFPLTT